jgi:3-oxoacyl-[acyl-carrier-protein] synthase III
MMLLYSDRAIFIHDFDYRLGSVQRDLEELKADRRLLGTVETLDRIGYHYNFSLGNDESLLSLARHALSQVLLRAREPRGLVFQHSFAESAVLTYNVNETNVALRTRYFAAEVMRELQLDHLPYLCSFASGCAGFMSVLSTAGGLLSTSLGDEPAICVMADSNPPGVPYDMMEERILGSDHSSAFVVDHEQSGYQLLGINYYSTTRTKVPFIEIVKRTVQMVQELAQSLQLKSTTSDVVIHYPNIFPDAWKMVTRYLQLPHVQHIMDGMPDRAHCGATDPVISLAKFHSNASGRLHVVVNYGVGLHLGVCFLKEQDANS